MEGTKKGDKRRSKDEGELANKNNRTLAQGIRAIHDLAVVSYLGLSALGVSPSVLIKGVFYIVCRFRPTTFCIAAELAHVLEIAPKGIRVGQ